MKDRVSELLKEIHKGLNTRGEYNTYLITENLSNHQVLTECYTNKENLSEEESKSFSKMFSHIKPYIQKREKLATDEKNQLAKLVKSVFINALKDMEYIEQEHFDNKEENQRVLRIGHSLACYLKGLGQSQCEVVENLYLFGFTENEVTSIL